MTALITAPPKSASDATTSSSTSSGLDRRAPPVRRLGPSEPSGLDHRTPRARGFGPPRACKEFAICVVNSNLRYLRLPGVARGCNCVRALRGSGARARTAAHRVSGARRRMASSACGSVVRSTCLTVTVTSAAARDGLGAELWHFRLVLWPAGLSFLPCAGAPVEPREGQSVVSHVAALAPRHTNKAQCCATHPCARYDTIQGCSGGHHPVQHA